MRKPSVPSSWIWTKTHSWFCSFSCWQTNKHKKTHSQKHISVRVKAIKVTVSCSCDRKMNQYDERALWWSWSLFNVIQLKLFDRLKTISVQDKRSRAGPAVQLKRICPFRLHNKLNNIKTKCLRVSWTWCYCAAFNKREKKKTTFISLQFVKSWALTSSSHDTLIINSCSCLFIFKKYTFLVIIVQPCFPLATCHMFISTKQTSQ